jgi:GNAT superfamily N-acetyltransferase
MAQHSGEERFLLFRSDQAGAIGKIIFSSVEHKQQPCGRDRTREGQTHDTENTNHDDHDSTTDLHTDNSSKTAGSAKIHVLDVKADYRGKDLGALLFTQATIALLQRYDTVDCQLHAEEDSRRHGRLLHYYQQLGCELKPKAKTLFVNNNDGETYRKVPMHLHLRQPTKPKSLLGVNFLPIQLLQAAGGRATTLMPESTGGSARKLDWLILDDGSGTIQLQTTLGQYLRTDGLGICSTTDQMDDSCCFYLHQVPHPNANENCDPILGRENERWVFQSTKGGFLTIDCATLACSKDPAIWFTRNDSLTLTCTHNSSPRRQHYNHCWTRQTVAFVQEMRRRYLTFQLTTMTLLQGLDLLKCIPCHRFSVQHTKHTPSMRAHCFRTAELARINGHPDWVQLIALM